MLIEIIKFSFFFPHGKFIQKPTKKNNLLHHDFLHQNTTLFTRLLCFVNYLRFFMFCAACQINPKISIPKATKRQDILEKSVSEAQFSENRVQNFQQWIYRVDELLSEHLDNDTTMDDLPHDFQV